MQTIKEILGKSSRETPEKLSKKRGGINSDRADVVARLMSFMGEDRRTEADTDDSVMRKRISLRTKYWLGRTRKLSPGDIYRLMQQAKDGRNAQALFQYLLKNYGKNKTT